MKTNKSILLSLVNSLNDNECGNMLQCILDKEYIKDNSITIGKVVITQGQYNKLIWMWGKDKLDKCIEILNEWLDRKKPTKYISHYRQLTRWVEQKYYQVYDVNDKTNKLNIDIRYKWQAKRYIQSIPKELRSCDSDCIYLINKFGVDILC